MGLCTAWTAWRLRHIVVTFGSCPVTRGTVDLLLATPIVISLSSGSSPLVGGSGAR